MIRKAWAWFAGLPAWQKAAVVVVIGVCGALIAARLWDALGAFVAALFGIGGGGGAAVKAGRRAVAARKAAKAAAGLGEAIADAADAHAEADAEAAAKMAEADADVAAAKHAAPPADDLEPMRFDALEGE